MALVLIGSLLNCIVIFFRFFYHVIYFPMLFTLLGVCMVVTGVFSVILSITDPMQYEQPPEGRIAMFLFGIFGIALLLFLHVGTDSIHVVTIVDFLSR